MLVLYFKNGRMVAVVRASPKLTEYGICSAPCVHRQCTVVFAWKCCLFCLFVGRGYSQIQYLWIRCTSQIQYLWIRCTSQILYLWIRCTSQVHFMGNPSPKPPKPGSPPQFKLGNLVASQNSEIKSGLKKCWGPNSFRVKIYFIDASFVD